MLLAGIPVLYKESGLIPTQSTEQMVETRLLRLVGLSLLLQERHQTWLDEEAPG